ncbi:MAG: hypothetical protein H6592_10420 [Flavobacteriales bacterium]|nr:hypothetical protein [Flavobacteriales bacterium]
MSVKVDIPPKELPERSFVRYVFIDVVEFTRDDRSDEDMARIILTLNEIVEHALVRLHILHEDRIILPTGDGMCIAITGKSAHDIHLRLALEIRGSNDGYNALHTRTGEIFQLRMAVHQHDDFELLDINKNRNIFGHGINTAARLLSACDPSQIAVSSAVHLNTSRDPKYMQHYGPEKTKMIKGTIYRYYSLGPGLNEDSSLLEIVGRYKSRIGPKLTLEDIYKLNPGDNVYHAVYGLGTIQTIGPRVVPKGRHVTIDFPERRHSIRLTNEKGNYHRWV